jgi:actin-related protein 6
VLDAGFSFTHAVAIFDGQVLESAVQRLNLGGKVLTNYLKELVSYRSINMMEETYLVDIIKEATCFVSQDPRHDLLLSKKPGLASPYRLEYVLPDGFTTTRGFARRPQIPDKTQPKPAQAVTEQVLALNNERFIVPELLFHPEGIQLDQAGVPELISEAVNAAHPSLHALLYSNVLLMGGTARCPGFCERIRTELRTLVPDEYELNVQLADDPVTAAWAGGSLLGSSSAYRLQMVTRQQYEEQGGHRVRWGGQPRQPSY